MEDEEARKAEKPIVDAAAATALASELYGLTVVPGTIKELDSYDDRNFYFRATPSSPPPASDANATTDSSGTFHFVLKVHNGVESQAPAFIEAQNEAMELVRKSGTWSPRAIPSVGGLQIATAERALASGTLRKHAVRLLPFRPGKLLGDVVPSLELLGEIGKCAAAVTAALSEYEHPATVRVFMWDLAQAADIAGLLPHLPAERRETVDGVLADFKSVVLPLAPKLQKSVIHGDLNDQNVLIDETGSAVLGVIDFGDMMHSWRVNEIAITAAYILIMLEYERSADAAAPPEPGSALVALVQSYTALVPLTEEEWTVLPILISCRVAVSLTVGAYSSSKDPDVSAQQAPYSLGCVNTCGQSALSRHRLTVSNASIPSADSAPIPMRRRMSTSSSRSSLAGRHFRRCAPCPTPSGASASRHRPLPFEATLLAPHTCPADGCDRAHVSWCT